MSLRQLQTKFVWMLVELLLWGKEQGYEFTFGRFYTEGDPRLHGKRLAADLNLFTNGVYQTGTEAHRPLGVKWESMGGSWGGRFKDGNHYSLAYGGMR